MTNILQRDSILGSDAYKFSMGQAGFPLRQETFTFSFRKQGWHYNPYDLEAEVRHLFPSEPTDDEIAYLAGNNYSLTGAMREAVKGELKVSAVPEGSWFFQREPILTVRGPSFLGSWIEDQLTWLNYGIQLATDLLKPDIPKSPLRIVCPDHEDVVSRVFHRMGRTRELDRQQDAYATAVRDQAQRLVEALGGDPAIRLIEGGLRAALCMQHHEMVLAACAEAGIQRTSNVFGAKNLGLIPSGTAGHEHSQRCGSDWLAYHAYMERVPGLVSCLSDTTDTLRSGLPTTIEISKANQDRTFLFRLDSGDRAALFHYCASEFLRVGAHNVLINIAGDVDEELIRRIEVLRELIKWPRERLSYMVGGALTARTLPTSLTRNRVAAVYKLSMTGDRPTMKMSDDLGKRSIPGTPVAWRRLRGDGPFSVIGQAGEPVPENYVLLNGNPEAMEYLRTAQAHPSWDQNRFAWGDDSRQGMSPETQRLIDGCLAEHEAACHRL